MATRTKTQPETAERHYTLVRLAPTSIADQVCAGSYVFDRGAPPIKVPPEVAAQLVAESAGCLTTEE